MIRRRGGSLEVVVYRGRVAGKSAKVSRAVRIADHGGLKAAQRAARQVELDLMADAAAGREQAAVGQTVGQLIDRWLDVARIEESTRYQARHALDRHVRPVLGDMKVARLTAEDLDVLYRRLEHGRRGRKALAPSTVRRIHATLRSMLAQAVRWHWIDTNPAEDASPPSVEAGEPEAPSTKAVRALLDHLRAVEPEIAMFVRLDAVSGMRRAEVCALRRSDLDLDAGTLRKQRSLGMAKGAPYVKATKNRRAHALALDGETVHQLRLHLKAQDELAAHCAVTIGADAYVFSLRVDCSTPMRPDYVTKRIRARRADRDEHGSLVLPECQSITLLSLRHWMATQGLSDGAVKAVQGRGGWARASTPLDLYGAHVPPDDVVLARNLAARLDVDPLIGGDGESQ